MSELVFGEKLPATGHQPPLKKTRASGMRLPGRLPILGDIGEVWPLLALKVAKALGVTLDFMSYKQSLPAGREMREWIVDNIKPMDSTRMLKQDKNGSNIPGH
jgi:hypothetical protein